mmetsp:Transcript_5590/g.19891  ORF Transcript_5590/g.19891 Transcript_5590/m.19891 type:complete len:124 (-) Transcript_5590:384-755(-)
MGAVMTKSAAPDAPAPDAYAAAAAPPPTEDAVAASLASAEDAVAAAPPPVFSAAAAALVPANDPVAIADGRLLLDGDRAWFPLHAQTADDAWSLAWLPTNPRAGTSLPILGARPAAAAATVSP